MRWALKIQAYGSASKVRGQTLRLTPTVRVRGSLSVAAQFLVTAIDVVLECEVSMFPENFTAAFGCLLKTIIYVHSCDCVVISSGIFLESLVDYCRIVEKNK